MASKSTSSSTSNSTMMDPSSSASVTNEWGSEETIDFIRVLGSTQDHHGPDENRYGDDSYWAMVASKMEALGRGYPARTPHHLRCKCQSLLSTYMKAKEQQELEGVHTFECCPFYDELQAIFTLDIPMPKQYISSDQHERDVQEAHEEPLKNVKNVRELPAKSRDKKRMRIDDKERANVKLGKDSGWDAKPEKSKVSKLHRMQEVLEEFLQHQQRLDMVWREEMERREEERRTREREARAALERLERERMMKEQQWREREEQRMLRMEARAERRDAMFNAIFDILVREDKTFARQQ